jgi:hypothetical protein
MGSLPRSTKEEIQRIQHKSYLTDSDCYIIDRYFPTALLSNFKSRLSGIELKEFQQIESFNVWRISSTFVRVLENPDEALNSIEKGARDEIIRMGKTYNLAPLDELANKCVVVAKLILMFETNNELKIVGKIPTSGFFCTRQDIANTWLVSYFELLEYWVKQIIKKSNGNINTATGYVLANTAYYLNSAQPETFPLSHYSSSSMNDHVYRIQDKLLSVVKNLHLMANRR